MMKYYHYLEGKGTFKVRLERNGNTEHVHHDIDRDGFDLLHINSWNGRRTASQFSLILNPGDDEFSWFTTRSRGSYISKSDGEVPTKNNFATPSVQGSDYDDRSALDSESCHL